MYEKYRYLRDKHGLTDYRIAKDTGIHPSLFSEWKAEKYEPKLKKLQILADYFNVPITYFTERKET